MADVEAEETMRSSEKFEEEAMEVFGVFDEVMESIELVDVALNALDRAGRRHAKTEGFQPGYYKVRQIPAGAKRSASVALMLARRRRRRVSIKITLGECFDDNPAKHRCFFCTYFLRIFVIIVNVIFHFTH